MKHTAAVLAMLASSTMALAADWPAWRGPTGQGESIEKNLPLKWSNTENVKWKVPLGDPGNSTPVIWKKRIFLTQANKGGTVRSLLCFDRADGKQLWRNDVNYPETERNWKPDWYGNASPATDGERVVVSFGSAGMFCYDVSGKELWKRTDLGKWEHQFGNGSSPVLYKDLAILWCGPNASAKDRNFLLAVDKKTGKTAWEHEEKGGSWGTPLITKVGDKDHLILGIPRQLKAYDPANGKELWFCDGLTDLVYTSALVGN